MTARDVRLCAEMRARAAIFASPRGALWAPAGVCWFGAWQSAGLTGVGIGSALVLLTVAVAARRYLLALCLLAALGAWQLPKRLDRNARVPAGLAVADVRVVESRVVRTERARLEPRALVSVERGIALADGATYSRGIALWVEGLDLPAKTRARVTLQVRPRALARNSDGPFTWPDRADGSATLIGLPTRVHTRSIAEATHKLRGWFRRRLHQDLQPDAAALVCALSLGDQALIDRTDYNLVRRAGAAHVLAVSGLHVGVVSLLMLWLCRRVLLALGSHCRHAQAFNVHRVSHALIVPLTLAHGQLAGGSPSALRASWMIAAAHTTLFLGFRPCARGALIALPLLVAAHDVSLLRRPAFVLSYAACLALVHAATASMSVSIKPHQRIVRWLRTSISVSTRITVATTPIVLSCFGELAWVGALSNIVFVPLTSIILVPAAYAQLALSALGVGRFGASAVEALREGFFVLCGWIGAQVPPFVVPPLSLTEVSALSTLCLAYFLKRKPQRVAFVVFVACALWHASSPYVAMYTAPPLTIDLLDVGQGDATLIRTPRQSAMIDMGRTVSFGPDANEPRRDDIVAHALRAADIETLDLLIISHAHPDHYVSWRAVFEQVQVRELWLPALGLIGESRQFRELVERARKRGTTVRLAPALCGRRIKRLDLGFDVLAPCARPKENVSLNDASFVVRLHHGPRSMLFAGDIEAAAERGLLNKRADLRADLVKVPHHGSKTSSTLEFVAAVAPRLAIVSAGLGNRFGHPSKQVVQRWKRFGCVLVTADVGGVTLVSDGRAWTLENPTQAQRCKGSFSRPWTQKRR